MLALVDSARKKVGSAVRPCIVQRERPLQTAYVCHSLPPVIGPTVSKYYEVIRLPDSLRALSRSWRFCSLYPSFGAKGISRVHDASLVTCRSLRTPSGLHRLTHPPALYWLRGRYHAGQPGLFMSKRYPLPRSYVSKRPITYPVYASPLLFTRAVVFPDRYTVPPEAQHSVMGG